MPTKPLKKSSWYDTMEFSYKRIADPVHGSIGISNIEAEILQTKSFLRIRNISQLGIASDVYPSANFSRFSHSLGVCHITGKLLHTLKDHPVLLPKLELDEKELQLYRLAALLHDIGHYPFSHAMETAVNQFYPKKVISKDGIIDIPVTEVDDTPYLSHEAVGTLILETDLELTKIFKRYDINPQNIHKIFTHSSPPILANLISSDLDADRIDYMLRSSRHTGLPYGNVDVNYLITQLTLAERNDNGGNNIYICVPKKALRTVEHFLLCRYFEYQQVYYHKTVVGLELILKDVLKEMLKLQSFMCDRDSIKEMVLNGNWGHFDEICIWEKMRKLLLDQATTKPLKTKLGAILLRNPAKLIYEWDEFADTENNFKMSKKIFENVKTELAKKFSIDETY